VTTILLVVAGLLAIIAVALAWRAEQRIRSLEQELVLRQQDIAQQATEARMLSQQTLESLRQSVAKVALLEARLSEVGVQRTQLDDLILSLSRSRDENVAIEIESALRVAQQQSLLSGSAEPLVAALRMADERLARHDQPRLEPVRRAIARDLDRVRKVAIADIGGMLIKLDEVVRAVDELPLLPTPEPRRSAPRAVDGPRGAASASAAGQGGGFPDWWPQWARAGAWEAMGERLWSEIRSLVRVSRIDSPDAMLIAPEQSYFLRENVKLRLLNARLALLSRQFDTAQSDLRSVVAAIERYHDTGSRRTQLVLEGLRQIATQARQGSIPLPDDTLAALSAASAR
jgi:uroporphyrin-III C-methyltransferase